MLASAAESAVSGSVVRFISLSFIEHSAALLSLESTHAKTGEALSGFFVSLFHHLLTVDKGAILELTKVHNLII